MISDTLFEAHEEIERYMREMPQVYDSIRPRLDALLAEMDAIRALLDTPPPGPSVICLPVTVEEGRPLNPGDLIVIDCDTGRARLAIAGEPGQRFRLPPSFTITQDGILEMPLARD